MRTYFKCKTNRFFVCFFSPPFRLVDGLDGLDMRCERGVKENKDFLVSAVG